MGRKGLTFIEIIVVMIIIGVMAVVAIPSFYNATEQARAKTAQANLLAIYTAQQNYMSINGSYCFQQGGCGNTLSQLLSTFPALNITDDGTYNYSCKKTGGNNYNCTATRTGGGGFTLTVQLDAPIQMSGGVNPSCSSATWCPNS